MAKELPFILEYYIYSMNNHLLWKWRNQAGAWGTNQKFWILKLSKSLLMHCIRLPMPLRSCWYIILVMVWVCCTAFTF